MDLLFTDHYRLLAYLHEIMNKQHIAHCTQIELSEQLHMCRATINTLIKYLRAGGYLKPEDGHNARYELTSKAVKIVDGIKSIKF